MIAKANEKEKELAKVVEITLQPGQVPSRRFVHSIRQKTNLHLTNKFICLILPLKFTEVVPLFLFYQKEMNSFYLVVTISTTIRYVLN